MPFSWNSPSRQGTSNIHCPFFDSKGNWSTWDHGWKQHGPPETTGTKLTYPKRTFWEQSLSLSNIYILYITWFQQIHGEIREMAKVFFSGHTAVLWINLCSYQITTTKALALTKSHKPGASPRNEVVDGPNQVMCSVGRPGRDRCGLLQTSGPSRASLPLWGDSWGAPSGPGAKNLMFAQWNHRMFVFTGRRGTFLHLHEKSLRHSFD